MRFRCVAGLGLWLAFCPPVLAVEPDAPERVISRLDAVSLILHQRLEAKFSESVSLPKLDHGALVEFYSEPGRDLLWVRDNGLNGRAWAAIAEIRQADGYGLDARAYRLPEPDGLARHDGMPAAWLAEAELQLSATLLAYAHHAQAGRLTPSSLSKYLDPKRELPDPLAVLHGVAGGGKPMADYLRSFHPPHRQFWRLKDKLAEIRARTAERRVVVLPTGTTLSPGDSHPHVALLRRRLDVPPPDDEEPAAADYYDDGLAEAVRAFQKRAGLRVDGIIGPATRAILNGEAGPQTETLIANMERWRWMPRDFGARHVWVNIPEFLVRLEQDGTVIHQERVVVGAAKTQTPVFSAEISNIVFNPYWNVPRSITIKEILPRVRSNPDYLVRNRLQVMWRGHRAPVDPYRVDWEQADPGKFRLRQPPGSFNALGNIKIDFPNRHAVYMHDTPTKRLFERSVRAFSHGCIRVRNPRKFVELLLADQQWTAAGIERAIDRGANRFVKLDAKIPVHILYFTAWVDDDGRTRLFRDLYDHDRRVVAGLKL